MAYTGRLRLKWVRDIQVYKRVEISVVGVYEKGYENLLDFGLYKGSKGLTDSFYGWE